MNMGYRCFSQIIETLLLAKVATKGTLREYTVLLLDVHAPAESSQRALLYLPNSKYLLV
jgi:hypothetical protein